MSTHSSVITKQSTPFISKQPKNIEDNEELSLVESLSSLIGEIIRKNRYQRLKSNKTLFYNEDSKIPDISISSFIFYIYSYLNLDFSTILLSLISIQRFLNLTKDKLSKNNFHKLFITSCLLNSKHNQEHSYSSKAYAIIGKISNSELIILEKEFFNLIDYKLYVNDEVYQSYFNLIKKRAVNSNKKKFN